MTSSHEFATFYLGRQLGFPSLFTTTARTKALNGVTVVKVQNTNIIADYIHFECHNVSDSPRGKSCLFLELAADSLRAAELRRVTTVKTASAVVLCWRQQQ